MANHLIWVLLMSQTLLGMDLGTHGQAFPILENDLLEEISERASQTNFDQCRKVPRPIGLPRALEDKSRLFDPAVIVEETIKGNGGRVLYPKGTRVNPLKTVSLSHNLIFFDSRDERQLAWACEQEEDCVWILTGGNPFELERKLHRPIYFDQGGMLSTRLEIHCVPTIVSQVREELLIREVAL